MFHCCQSKYLIVHFECWNSKHLMPCSCQKSHFVPLYFLLYSKYIHIVPVVHLFSLNSVQVQSHAFSLRENKVAQKTVFHQIEVFPRAEEEVYFYLPTLSKLLIEPVSDFLMVVCQ